MFPARSFGGLSHQDTADCSTTSGFWGGWKSTHKFKKVYKMAADLGVKLVVHAGEEVGPDYIYEMLFK